MSPPVNVLCPADETQEEFFSNHNIALLGSHRQTLMIKLTRSDCAAAPDPDLHRRHQIHLKYTGWNASLNLPRVPKWQRNKRILLGVQICILYQHRFHSLKDLQMCWSHYRPVLLCCIICGSFLAISPAWKISLKHLGFPLGLFCLEVISACWCCSSIIYCCARGLTVCRPTNFKTVMRFFFFIFFLSVSFFLERSAKTDAGWVEYGMKYSISSHCQMFKSSQCVHQFVTGKLYPISRIIENDLEIFTPFLQTRSVSNHAKHNSQRNGDPP